MQFLLASITKFYLYRMSAKTVNYLQFPVFFSPYGTGNRLAGSVLQLATWVTVETVYLVMLHYVAFSELRKNWFVKSYSSFRRCNAAILAKHC